MMSQSDSQKIDAWLESELFLEFQAACETNDAKVALESLIVWLGHFQQELQFTTQRFSQAFGQEQFVEQLTIVRLSMENPCTDWSGKKLYKSVINILFEIRTSLPSAQ